MNRNAFEFRNKFVCCDNSDINIMKISLNELRESQIAKLNNKITGIFKLVTECRHQSAHCIMNLTLGAEPSLPHLTYLVDAVRRRIELVGGPHSTRYFQIFHQKQQTVF